MNAPQKQFLRDEFFSLTLMATVQRAGVFKRDILEEKRKPFHRDLCTWLEKIARDYNREVSEETHIKNILKLSEQLSKSHSRILSGGRFRIGSAQKALNLYLKYLWCIGLIVEPPHCPFDRRIIEKLPLSSRTIWTKLDKEADYRKLVSAAKDKARPSSLAEWELETYNNRSGRKRDDDPNS